MWLATSTAPSLWPTPAAADKPEIVDDVRFDAAFTELGEFSTETCGVEPAYALRLLEEHPERVGHLLEERVFDVAILVDALVRLTDGETVVDPTIVARLLGRRRVRDPLEEITAREREVLALVAEGLSNRAIAERLFVTDARSRHT